MGGTTLRDLRYVFFIWKYVHGYQKSRVYRGTTVFIYENMYMDVKSHVYIQEALYLYMKICTWMSKVTCISMNNAIYIWKYVHGCQKSRVYQGNTLFIYEHVCMDVKSHVYTTTSDLTLSLTCDGKALNTVKQHAKCWLLRMYTFSVFPSACHRKMKRHTTQTVYATTSDCIFSWPCEGKTRNIVKQHVEKHKWWLLQMYIFSVFPSTCHRKVKRHTSGSLYTINNIGFHFSTALWGENAKYS